MRTRRQFLQSGLVAGMVGPLNSARAIEPLNKPGSAHIKLSIAAYSFHRFLNLDLKPRPAMTLDDFIDFAARVGLGAVELTAYYFPRTTSEYLAHLKGKCTRLGLDISGTAVGNDFCVQNPSRLREEIASVKRWVEHSSRLGAKPMRIFAGYLEQGDSEVRARGRCVEAIEEACDYAGKYGIFLALENHGGITASLEQMLAIVRAVRHDWFGVNLDTANFHTPDPYGDLAKLAPYAVTVQIKTEIHAAGKKKEAADLDRLFGMLRSVGYRGYVALEYEAAEDPRMAVPRHVETLKKLAD